MYDTLLFVISTINAYMFDYVLTFLLVVVGLWFSFKTKCVQVAVSTGNIVVAAGAILVGGPGAIFWMWIMGFLGMATMYAETVCALSTRKI